MIKTLILSFLPIVMVPFGFSQGAFERREFPMPERCDRALAVDIDSDEDLDLVGICRTQVMAIQLTEGKRQTLYKASDGAMIHGALWDGDGDGDQDVAICRFQKGSGPAVFWLDNPSWKVHVIDDQSNGVHGLAAGDLDGNGREDLIAANVMGFRPLSVSWYDSECKTRRFIHESKAGSRPHYLETGDLDGDGKLDVVFGRGDGFAWYRGPNWEQETIAMKKGGTNVSVADVNGDDRLDVIGSCGHGTGVYWYQIQLGRRLQ